MNILTVAVVTKPFMYEGNRMRFAQAGIESLYAHVDSLIIVPNSKLIEVLGSNTTVPEAFKAANGVLQGAVAGIAEVINVPGLINVDFADVRTVMSENGMAMMGSAVATGPDRARIAAEGAIASPLLEDVDMSGAKGVLVNITSSSSLKLQELEDVMECVQFAAEEATVIVGSVFDENMGDNLRVTVVATGLGTQTKKQQKPEIVYREETYQRTGTHNEPIINSNGANQPQTTASAGSNPSSTASIASSVASNFNPSINYNELDTPAVIRRGRRETVVAMEKAGMDTLDIPSFLRKQAD
jgi:cell division protein FtsZ